MGTPEFFLYLPQLRMEIDAITERAVVAERSGFTGIAFMDHLAPPLAETSPMYEALTLATWIAARTTRLVVGHLVLCDAMRHPAVLARQAVTLDHASGGRFELGLGWGSVPAELRAFGVSLDEPAARVGRLAESLALLEGFWSGEPVTFAGAHFSVDSAGQRPTPQGRIPILLGGSGPKTLALVRQHADWWNLPITALDRLDALRPEVGSARVSTQHLVAFAARSASLLEVEASAVKRYGGMRSPMLVGEGEELVAAFEDLTRRGVERFYVWFTDFAPPATLEAFGEEVIASFRG